MFFFREMVKCEQHINPLSAGAVHIRFHIFYNTLQISF